MGGSAALRYFFYVTNDRKLRNVVGVALLTDAIARVVARDRAPAVVSDGLNEWKRVTHDGEPLYRCRGAARPLYETERGPTPVAVSRARSAARGRSGQAGRGDPQRDRDG